MNATRKASDKHHVETNVSKKNQKDEDNNDRHVTESAGAKARKGHQKIEDDDPH